MVGSYRLMAFLFLSVVLLTGLQVGAKGWGIFYAVLLLVIGVRLRDPLRALLLTGAAYAVGHMLN